MTHVYWTYLLYYWKGSRKVQDFQNGKDQKKTGHKKGSRPLYFIPLADTKPASSARNFRMKTFRSHHHDLFQINSDTGMSGVMTYLSCDTHFEPRHALPLQSEGITCGLSERKKVWYSVILLIIITAFIILSQDQIVQPSRILTDVSIIFFYVRRSNPVKGQRTHTHTWLIRVTDHTVLYCIMILCFNIIWSWKLLIYPTVI